MSLNVLVVEDDPRVADFLRRGLVGEGWTVTLATSGEAALNVLDGPDFDVVVLDILLPGISGHDVCRRMRWKGDQTPILMLTALDSSDDIVSGLRKGADDYLAKPFRFDELIARIEALHRRASQAGTQESAGALRAGPISFDPSAMRFSLGGAVLDITGRERDLMRMFLTNPDRAMSRERILSTVWGDSEDPLTNVIDVYVARLRKKLGPAGAAIRTVYGVGYRFEPDRIVAGESVEGAGDGGGGGQRL